MTQRESKGVGQDGPTGSRSTARRILRIAASCVVLAALGPFAANEQLRSQYVQTILDYVAKVVPPRLVFLGDSNTLGGFSTPSGSRTARFGAISWASSGHAPPAS